MGEKQKKKMVIAWTRKVNVEVSWSQGRGDIKMVNWLENRTVVQKAGNLSEESYPRGGLEHGGATTPPPLRLPLTFFQVYAKP